MVTTNMQLSGQACDLIGAEVCVAIDLKTDGYYTQCQVKGDKTRLGSYVCY